jgi:FkbM family methyltransferase
MSFNSLALALIDERLRSRPATDEILAPLIAAARRGKIAFFPCSRATNDLLGLLRRHAPDALANVVACFDRSGEAFAAESVPVYPLAELPRFAPDLEAVVVTANVFYGRELATVAATGAACPLLPVSGIDLELGRLDPERLSREIRAVCDLLVDEKSRVDYLLAWLARLLNDENLTQVFAVATPVVTPEADGAVYYKQYRLDQLPPEIVGELHLDVYTLGEVAVGKGDTVLDVGAFKGDTAVCFADRVGPAGRVYSFEPVGANYAALVRNVRQNGLDAVVHPVNKGCGSSCGRVRIATAPQGSPWAFFSPERGVEEIEVTTIDAFVAETGLARVDFIKFDVEGVERDVLEGACRTIATRRPKLAVSLYHNLVDLTELPLLVNALGDYELSLRCRTSGPWSIFLYAAPREGA